MALRLKLLRVTATGTVAEEITEGGTAVGGIATAVTAIVGAAETSRTDDVRVACLGEERHLPAYASDGAAGADLRAAIPTPITLEPGERSLVPTGIAIALPAGYEAQVRPRSGLAVRHGVTVLNAPGTVDADYRGEIAVPLINLGSEAYSIAPDDRIAQLIIAPVARARFEPVSRLDPTTRGSGGFGSTGHT